MGNRFGAFAAILTARGITPGPGTTLLDLGCGSGELVASAHLAGVDAYGCDIDFSSEWIKVDLLRELQTSGRVRAIECSANGKVSPNSGAVYRLPFADSSFDVVISDQVLEHVGNYDEVMCELYRVMRPGATFLHIFPSRTRFIEPHVFVPCASFFHPRWWLWVWALLGVRNTWQKGLGVRRTVEENDRFLHTMVNYLPRAKLRQALSRGFVIESVEKEFMRDSKRARLLIWAWLYRFLLTRVVFGVRLREVS